MSGRWPGNPQIEKTSFGGLTRGELMTRVKSRGNRTTEQQMMHLLRKARLNGWRRHSPILGRPDFIWKTEKLAVFVDGCFWHGHACGRNLTPKTNASAWAQKITTNRARDKRITATLRKDGWVVIRIWECNLLKHPKRCVALIQRALLG